MKDNDDVSYITSDDYTIVHIGDGIFEVILTDGRSFSAGQGLCGMIRYTYFEDFTIPDVGWSIKRSILNSDYMNKVIPDIKACKVKVQK